MRILFLLTCTELKNDHYHDVQQHDNQNSDEKPQDLKDNEVKKALGQPWLLLRTCDMTLRKDAVNALVLYARPSFQARGLLFGKKLEQ